MMRSTLRAASRREPGMQRNRAEATTAQKGCKKKPPEEAAQQLPSGVAGVPEPCHEFGVQPVSRRRRSDLPAATWRAPRSGTNTVAAAPTKGGCCSSALGPSLMPVRQAPTGEASPVPHRETMLFLLVGVRCVLAGVQFHTDGTAARLIEASSRSCSRKLPPSATPCVVSWIPVVLWRKPTFGASVLFARRVQEL